MKMEKSEVLSKINRIVIDVLELDDLLLTEETTASEVEDWDSIMHVEIIVAIEDEFKVKFTTSEIESFVNVGDITALTQEKVNAKS